jgi:hypothetical protein
MSAYGVLLDDYSYMSDPKADDKVSDHANARSVFARLTGDAQPRMPMGGPYWSAAQLEVYSNWMTDGFQP